MAFQVSRGLLLGDAQHLLAGPGQKRRRGRMAPAQRCAGRNRREKQHGDLQLDGQLGGGHQPLLVRVGTVERDQDTMERKGHLTVGARLDQQHRHACLGQRAARGGV